MAHDEHSRFQAEEYCERCERKFEEWYWGPDNRDSHWQSRRRLAEAGADLRNTVIAVFLPLVEGLEQRYEINVNTKGLFR